ncbi:FAD-binding oxidoreductase [Gluconobacter oxydans]|uniref:FAD-binding oxidoreductase n=1 Tax=Gluconobacter oxydans TaxID=442 RepID=UPI0012DA3C43|nr:FAD-binding oxidoreductase [Gluconobacter oxydans]
MDDRTQAIHAGLQAIVGSDQIFTGVATDRWSRDWTGQFEGMPLAVVRPGTCEEIAAILRLAGQYHVPVVPIAGNTGLNGGAYGAGSILVSIERMNRIREIRSDARVAVVEAGVIVAALDSAVAQYGLTFPLTFGAAGSAMIGGVLSTNAGGANVLRYGNVRDLCLGLEVVLPDGLVLDLMTALKKDNSGFDLRDLIIGAEGQLGIITAAVLKLHPRPVFHATALVALEDLREAPALLNAFQDASGNAVTAYEFMSRSYVAGYEKLVPTARRFFETSYPAVLLVELATVRNEELGELLETVLGDAMERGAVADAVIAQSDMQRQEMWALREAAAELAFQRHPVIDTDIAVPLDRIAEYLDRIPARMAAIDPGFTDIAVAHFGDGNIHYTVWPSKHDPAVEAALRAAIDALAIEMDGTFSAEHGIGLCKLPSMAKHKSSVALDIMRTLKAAFDPNAILNPGKTLPGKGFSLF